MVGTSAYESLLVWTLGHLALALSPLGSEQKILFPRRCATYTGTSLEPPTARSNKMFNTVPGFQGYPRLPVLDNSSTSPLSKDGLHWHRGATLIESTPDPSTLPLGSHLIER